MKTADFLKQFSGKSPLKKAAAFLDVYPQAIHSWGEIVPAKWAFKLNHELGIPLGEEDYINNDDE